MIKRSFWENKLYDSWEKRSIIWLSGVRRVGKTTLVKMLSGSMYLNCDLSTDLRRLENPEFFYQSVPENKMIIFDEIHRHPDPSNLLKIAADEYPQIKIIATGSSTLEATSKFRDSLTGRKVMIPLSPVLWSECKAEFGINDLDKRLLHGGLPEMLLSKKKDPYFYNEWIDSYYARDVQELFSVRNRVGFLKLMNLLIHQSGGLLDYTEMSKLSTLSRPTVISHTEAMQISHVIHLVSPFSGGGSREIVKRPKCYAFDTGFVTHLKGWNQIRDEDKCILWEHLVLDMLKTVFPVQSIYYWRDKSDKEIDFIIKKGINEVDVIECKINPDALSIKTLKSFRNEYSEGQNYCISPYVKEHYQLLKEDLIINYISDFEQINKC
jgi:uncharacterized protein